MLITSPANERLKHARRVRDGREGDLIFIEGERLIEECLQAGLILRDCFHIPDISPRSRAIIEELEERGCPIHPTADEVLATLSDTVNTQGLIVLAERRHFSIESVMGPPGGSPPLAVCLDAVQDPGNMGTIMRTAEAAGVNGLLALKGSVDAFAPKTLRSAMGSAFRLPVFTDQDAEAIVELAQSAGLMIVATAADGDIVHSDFDWTQPVLIVFGNEARGVQPQLLERSDAVLRIPLCAPVESLNVAAAAAVVLFEAVRQRREAQGRTGCS
ncbi:MAG: RNA methyltransferase [Acidobacteria bacterium]|nr:RNA methyltransferase [Acidobacteriota bacterium]